MPVSSARSALPQLRPLSILTFLTRHLRPGSFEKAPGTGRLHEAFQVYRAEAHGQLLALPTGPYRTTYHYVLFITHGSFEALLGQHQITVEAGHLLFVPAGNTASLLALSSDLRGYFLLAEPDFLTTSLNRPGLLKQLRGRACLAQSLAAVPPREAQPLAYLFEVALAEFAGPTNSAELLRTLLRALLLKMEQQYGALPTPVPVVAGAIAGELLTHRFLDLLAASYRTLHTVAAYANRLCVTPNHLNRCVKSTTGRPTLAWITDTLVTEAKGLLRGGGYTVAETARELGFRNGSSFGRLFRQRTGCTPSGYREIRAESAVLDGCILHKMGEM